MITVVEGRPGMGKSVWLVSEILRYLRAGHTVYTNVAISDLTLAKKYRDKLFSVQSLEDIITLREGKIVLDEVQIYLNSRNWDKLDIRFQLLLQQHRKKGLDIIGATQSIKRADVVFRELVQVFYRIKKLVSFRIPKTKLAFGFFYLREYDPDDIEMGGGKSSQKALGWFIPFLADPYTFGIYDTTQEYEPTIRIGQKYVEEYVIVERKTEVPILVSKKSLVKDPPEMPPATPAIKRLEIHHAQL